MAIFRNKNYDFTHKYFTENQRITGSSLHPDPDDIVDNIVRMISSLNSIKYRRKELNINSMGTYELCTCPCVRVGANGYLKKSGCSNSKKNPSF